MANNPNHLDNLRPPWQPGEGPRQGRQTCGATVREWINILSEQQLTGEELRKLAYDETIPHDKQIAAMHKLAATERANLVDYEAWLQGQSTLKDLAQAGVDVRHVKKAKIGDKGSREIELHDRSGQAFDRVVDTTSGKPVQPVEVSERPNVVNDL